jgi:spermidine/putrescine transport system ATP-binding protein
LAVSVVAKVLNRIFVGDFTQYRLASDRLGEFLVVSPRRNERDVGIFEIGDSVAAGWRGDAAQVLADV